MNDHQLFDVHRSLSMNTTYCGLRSPDSTATDGKLAFFGAPKHLTLCPACAILAHTLHKGSDAQELRDAAHEACHAIMWGVTNWSRRNIDRCKPRGRAAQIRDEITARAVEQLVCQDLDVKCADVKSCANTCQMELAVLDGIELPDGTWLEDKIRTRMKSREARKYADLVIALAEEKTP